MAGDGVVTTAVLVPAAGRGDRLGAGVAKALRQVRGEPLLVHALRALLAAPSVSVVVVAAPPDGVQTVSDLLGQHLPGAPVSVVAGGATRQESVAAALAVLPSEVDVVLVHDAARAFVPPSLVEAVVAAVRGGAVAAVPGLPIHDTVRFLADDGTAAQTLDRSRLRAVQTPQGFVRSVLDQAHRAAAQDGRTATDDAALVESAGGRVVVVEGADEAFKVTRPIDLLLAGALVDHRAASARTR